MKGVYRKGLKDLTEAEKRRIRYYAANGEMLEKGDIAKIFNLKPTVVSAVIRSNHAKSSPSNKEESRSS